MAMAPDIKPRMSLDPTGVDDDNRFVDVAQYYEQLGFIRRVADGYGVVSITARGIQYVEGDLQQQQSSGNVTYKVQNAYGSIFGTQQHAEMSNVSFDFNTVEAELDEVEEEIERRGGRDAAELRQLIAEVRTLHQNGELLDKGRLARFLGVIQRNGWVAGPVAGTLLSIVTGA